MLETPRTGAQSILNHTPGYSNKYRPRPTVFYNLFIKYSYIANIFKKRDIFILINLINRKHALLNNKSCRSYFDGNIDSYLKERVFNVSNYTRRWDKL